MLDEEEEKILMIPDAEATPTPEPEQASDGIETVSDSDVEIISDSDIQVLPEVSATPSAPVPPGGAWDVPLLLAQGATLGGREEIIGAGAGAIEGIKNIPQGPGSALKAAKTRYEQVMMAEHQKTQDARARNPNASIALEMLGSVASPVPFAGTAAKYGYKGMAALSGLVGGASGALENPEDRAGGAVTGAGIGLAVPAAAKGFGMAAELIPGMASTGAKIAPGKNGAATFTPAEKSPLVNRAAAGAAKTLAPGLDEQFYLKMLDDPAERRAAIEARKKYDDIPKAGEQVGELFDATISGVRTNQTATKLAGNKELVAQGALDAPLDNAIKYVDSQLNIIQSPENALNYSPALRTATNKALASLKGMFPDGNEASTKISRRDNLGAKIGDLRSKIALAQQSANKSALMQRRVQNLTNELQQAEAVYLPLNDEVDELLVRGFHEARKDLDAVINWNSGSNTPQPQRADQAKAKEMRSYIDAQMKTSPSWRAHDEAYAAWAPLETALQKHINENGGTGNVDYKKVWGLLNGAGGEGAAANKQRLLDNFGQYVRKHFSNDPNIMERLASFENMASELSLAKQFNAMGSATGMSTGRFGNLIGGAMGGLASGIATGGNPGGIGLGAAVTGAATLPATFPTIFLNLLNKAQTVKEFISKLSPYIPQNARNRAIIMVNQAIKQKPNLTVEEAAKIVQNQVQLANPQGDRK